MLYHVMLDPVTSLDNCCSFSVTMVAIKGFGDVITDMRFIILIYTTFTCVGLLVSERRRDGVY